MKNTSKFSFSLILLYSLSLLTAGCCLAGAQNKSLISSSRTVFDVGVVLDLRTPLGKMSESCISMALADFYTAHTNYTTILKLHWRDSNQDSVDTASMGERLVHSGSKFVVIVWVFVVWILTSSYTASFTSLLTIQQLQPTVNKVDDLVKNGDNVGYMQGSYVFDLLKSLKVEESKLKPYTSAEEYAEALSSGTVGAIVDDLPYIRLFLAKNVNCEKYKMVGPIHRNAGFGFVFPKGSPLVPELSWGILNVTEGDIKDNEAQWMGQQTTCGDQATTAESNSLTLDSFWGLFLITGVTSCLALFNYLLSFLYAHRHVLFPRNSDIPFRKRFIAIIRHFDERDLSHHSFNRRARVSSGSLELVRRHRVNSPPTDASVEQEPTSSNPIRRDWVVVTEVKDDTRHFQTFNCALLARRRWNLLYRAWRFRTRYARLHE